jgi:hypothetical protein
MGPERIELSASERERLKVLQQVEEGHLKQIDAARRLRLTDRQVRRLQIRLRQQGDGGIVHRLRGRRSHRKIPEPVRQRAVRQLRQGCYAGFGPTLAAEHLARGGMVVSRETLRKWMSAAGHPCYLGGTGKAEAAKLPGAGIDPEAVPGKSGPKKGAFT